LNIRDVSGALVELRMRRRFWVKLAITIPLLVALIALDGISVLEGLPLLLISLGLALVLADSLRARLRARGRSNLAMLPFMAAALVLLLAFCRGRNLSQAVLSLITVGVVFDILLIALAVIAEAGKRRARGVAEFVALLSLGLAMGFALSLVFLLGPGEPGATSLAGP